MEVKKSVYVQRTEAFPKPTRLLFVQLFIGFPIGIVLSFVSLFSSKSSLDYLNSFWTTLWVIRWVNSIPVILRPQAEESPC